MVDIVIIVHGNRLSDAINRVIFGVLYGFSGVGISGFEIGGIIGGEGHG
jgi:hypothetical protein